MIYDPSEHPFQKTHKIMTGSIVPRPIALVSTMSDNGRNNIAPFSYFNGVCSKPPTVMFAPARRGWDGEEKDTLINIRENKEFVINIVSKYVIFFGSIFINFITGNVFLFGLEKFKLFNIEIFKLLLL